MGASVMTEEKVYTPKQVADILQVNVRTIYRKIATGEIEAFTIGDTYRIRQSVLDAVMRGKKDKSARDET